MRRAWIVLLALGLTSCAEFRNFPCFHCTHTTYAKEPGGSTCHTCLRENVWSVCPACGFEEAQPGWGPFRCSACGIQAHAARCRTCSTVAFAREPVTSCPACARPPAASTAALKKDARARAERGEWDGAIEAYEAALRLDPRDAAARYALACALSRAGRTDPALDALERALADGYANWELLRKDPDLAPLRTHPRWAGLLKRAPNE
jgi:tetratricopeptide (TPR) repeat protein